MIDDFAFLFDRDIGRLYKEIEAYEKEEEIWIVKKEISNSAGTLCLHLCGNLKSFIGKEIGGFKYERDREREFAARNVPKAELLKEIHEVKLLIVNSLIGLSPSKLNNEFPIQVFNKEMTYGYFIIHLYGHLNYHLGQINYHRRLLTKS